MADGSVSTTLTLNLDDVAMAHLKHAAHEAGEATDVYAVRLLAEALEAAYWAPALASIAECERTGVSYEAGPVLEAFKARIRAKAAATQAVKD